MTGLTPIPHGISAATRTIGYLGMTAALLAFPLATHAAASSTAKADSFVYLTNNTTDPFSISIYDGQWQQAQTFHANVIFQGVAQQAGVSSSAQVAVANAVYATHPSGLIIDPTSATALNAPVAKFAKAGIPVITVDTTISDTQLLVSRITSNNFQGGELAAQTIAKQHNFSGEVAVENVEPGITTVAARMAGFVAQLKKYPHMKIVSVQQDLNEPTLAEAQTKSVILSHPGIVGIFATNEAGALGTGEAVVTSKSKGQITVVGYDAEPSEVSLLKKGVISVLIIQQPSLEGKLAMKYMEEYLTGHRAEIPKSVSLPNVVATTATANSPAVEKYFYSPAVDK